MNAAMASATPNFSATPATSTAAPRKEMTSSSLSLVSNSLPTMPVPQRAATASRSRKPKAFPMSAIIPPTSSAPEITGWSAARYRARKMSSTTMMPRIGLVSGFPMRPRSTSTLVTIADEEMPRTPARTSASEVPQPRAKPNASPAPTFSAR